GANKMQQNFKSVQNTEDISNFSIEVHYFEHQIYFLSVFKLFFHSLIPFCKIMTLRYLNLLVAAILFLFQPVLSESPACNEPNPSAPVCKILALSGGGIHGGWEIAALKGLTEYAKSVGQTLEYEFIAGVSAGALNAANSYFTNDTQTWVDSTYTLWQNIEDSDISDVCHGSRALWLWRKFVRLIGWNRSDEEYQGLCDTDALQRFLDDVIAEHGSTINRKYLITALRLHDGQPVQIDETDGVNLISDAAIASSSVPGLFIPKNILGDLHVDAGVYSNSNALEAVERCLALYESEIESADVDEPNPVNIIIDYLVPNAYLSSYDDSSANAVNVLSRSFDVLISRVGGLSSLVETLRQYPMAKYRYVLAPTVAERAEFPSKLEHIVGLH
ncbi:hypothetical protein IE077_001760, partial [Cardiosporidium cionae]